VTVVKHTFKPGSTVTIVINGPHGFTKTITVTANKHGGVDTTFHLPKHHARGHYTVTVSGHKAGHHVAVSSGFRVR
jgi:uncharacterized protein YfaS (alpha-2-macroglobulin family)